MSKKVITVVGARPQFIKAAAVSRVIRRDFSNSIDEILVHTGQHYDANMSQVFFDELDIPRPSYNLEVSGGSHGQMTGKMLEGIEKIFIEEKPDWVLVYGDTNSTLAGALAAVKLHIPVAHVEAGLRSFNLQMPEEVNRILTDRISSKLFCPTDVAVTHLANEGRFDGVSNVGDVMYDVALYYGGQSNNTEAVLSRYEVKRGQYVLATCHRAENTDNLTRLKNICLALADIAKELPVILPIHPRTRRHLIDSGMLQLLGTVRLIDPLSFLEMIALEQAAKVIVTDSGGVQKEAYFYGVPCVTMRDETEWTETVDLGWNTLAGASHSAIYRAFLSANAPDVGLSPYGDGHASERIISSLFELF